ncbi:hypothetical protein EYF80_068189 [Liparis tanakae]|uniref:Uncharacterized protein n=1 Tax=Liparis tanakae TaxID=230148 RepID=A0A4Z2DZ24_9TELE|nr:hypothetical protein EYF80_068189 [Liparis tanakae]
MRSQDYITQQHPLHEVSGLHYPAAPSPWGLRTTLPSSTLSMRSQDYITQQHPHHGTREKHMRITWGTRENT